MSMVRTRVKSRQVILRSRTRIVAKIVANLAVSKETITG